MNSDSNKLSEYYNEMSCNYKHLSLFEIALEYYLLYEVWEDGFNKYIDISEEECTVINDSVKKLVSGESLTGMIPEYNNIRKRITEKMQVVTAYVDRFIAYEHVMNRAEARFTMSEEERRDWLAGFDKDNYVRELMYFIFKDKDNAEITDSLHIVFEQLPMRMARSKYIDIIKSSIMLYKDSDKDSLDGFLYMLRTTAMIYEPEGMDRYFTEFAELTQELGEVDFTNIKKDYFVILQDKISKASRDLNDISDIYMIYQKIINMLYVYALNESAGNKESESICTVCFKIFEAIYNVFTGKTEDAYEAENVLAQIEGMPEKYYEKRISYESVFDTLADDDMENEDMEKLRISKILFSPSIFAEIEENAPQPVTEEYLNQVTEAFTADIMNVIKTYNRPLVRAVMSLSLARLPLFFNSADEIMEYIENSFSSCTDVPELIASVRLLDDIKENY